MTDRRALAVVHTRPALAGDVEWIAELRAVVLRADLTRLGRYDDARVRQRFRDAFEPTQTRVIVVDDQEVGSVALRDEGGSRWLEHFYIAPSHQGAGVGGRILTMLLDDEVTHRLNVLQGSPAQALYERHGFVVERQDEVDVFLLRERRGGRDALSDGR
ncbi:MULTISPECIES: GNAT family N-acetyltransferase [unclassified Microbacterium]|uniref:GNAT family N-acetyltransferase n=1 Tax=unclassified Microbacterium TaxID=2609290 RepID=UPI00109CF2EB|nr:MULTISPECIES: GNAT family N-acetyltransferase [unclassified Microbacterium]